MIQPMLAKRYDGKPIGSGWIFEAKLDGIRAAWDGRSLWTRGSKDRAPRTLTNPPEVLRELAASWTGEQLDGELFGQDWGTTASVVLRSKSPVFNSGVTYQVFDLTAQDVRPLCGQTLERRKDLLDRLFDARTFESIRPVSWFPLAGQDPYDVARNLVESGFEGAMLKRLASPYLAGVRSKDWLKVKFEDEVDAVILGAELGQGRFSEVLGAVAVRDGQGREFRVGGGFTEADRLELWRMHRENRLVGLPITVRYQPDEKIIGRFPKFVRLRTDL